MQDTGFPSHSSWNRRQLCNICRGEFKQFHRTTTGRNLNRSESVTFSMWLVQMTESNGFTKSIKSFGLRRKHVKLGPLPETFYVCTAPSWQRLFLDSFRNKMRIRSVQWKFNGNLCISRFHWLVNTWWNFRTGKQFSVWQNQTVFAPPFHTLNESWSK